MTAPTTQVTISRSTAAGGPTALTLTGTSESHDAGITGLTLPSLRPRIAYAPDSRYFDGSDDTAAAWEQDAVQFAWIPDAADDESDAQATYWEIAAAIAQRRFDVTTQISGADALVWRAKRGTLVQPERTYVNLANPQAQIFVVTIPVHPIPGSPP